jgi:CheY-like chemotaxis protein
MENETLGVLVITADLPAFEELREGLHRSEHDAYDVTHAGSVVEGFARLKDDLADVLILDVSKSAEGCLRSLERIRDRYPFLPLIILTAPEEEPFGKGLVERQLAHDYLVKSQYRDGIPCRAIRHATDRQRMREELQRYRDSVDDVPAFAITASWPQTIVCRKRSMSTGAPNKSYAMQTGGCPMHSPNSGARRRRSYKTSD